MYQKVSVIILLSLFYCMIVEAQGGPSLVGSYSGVILIQDNNPCALCDKYGECPANVSCTNNLPQTSQCDSGQVCLTRQWMLDGLSSCRAEANKAISSWSSRCAKDLGDCLSRCERDWWNRWVSCSSQMDQPGYDPDCFLYSNIIQTQCKNQCYTDFKSCHADLAISSTRMYSECDKSNPYPKCTTCSGDSDCAPGYKCRNGKQQCNTQCSSGAGCCPQGNTQCVKVCDGVQCDPGEVCRKEKSGSISFMINLDNLVQGNISDGRISGSLSDASISLSGSDSSGSSVTATGDARMGFIGTLSTGDGKSTVWFVVCASGACATQGSHELTGSYQGVFNITISSDGSVTGTLSAPPSSGNEGPEGEGGPESGGQDSNLGPDGEGKIPGGDNTGLSSGNNTGPGDNTGPEEDGQKKKPSGGSGTITGTLSGTSLSFTASGPDGKNQISGSGTGGLGFFGTVTTGSGDEVGWAAMCDGDDCMSCPEGQDKCDGICTDTNTSRTNCGACGKKCDADEVCSNGNCECSSGKMKCGTTCVDRYNDPSNCGGCGFVCASGKCSNGNCECPAGQTMCGTKCYTDAELSIDPLNCSSCGNTCGSNQTCVNSTCVDLTDLYVAELNTTMNATGLNATDINNMIRTITTSSGGCTLTYNCTSWAKCQVNGTQTRICKITNTCTMKVEEKEDMQRCNDGCSFDNPRCDSGSVCINNSCVVKECETDSDCNVNASCTTFSCSSYKCEYKKQSGCDRDGECVEVGTRQTANGSLLYCSSEGTWLSQIKGNEICENDYVCLSNQCSNGICKEETGQVSGTPDIFDRIMKAFSDIWNAIAGFFGLK